MRLSIVGTINEDLITDVKGERIRSLGGILYNTIALASLMPDDSIVPVAYHGTDCVTELHGLLSGFENVDYSGLVPWPGGCNENVLRYTSADQREETLSVSVPPVEMEMLEVCLDADIVLLNFVSGFDVKLETAKRFRDVFSKLLFMDVHSMTLGIDDNGTRFERNVTEWKEWSELADIVQMNLREASLFTGLEGTRDQLSASICEAGPDVCLITLGSRGVFFAEKKEGGFVMKTVEILPTEARDPTGCGDVFSAGFISSFARNRDVYDACVAGNRAAAACCESAGIESLGEVLSR